jgi:UDPglucose--hexose-1-phosphate uridylyltransferase
MLDLPHRRFNPLTREWVLVSPHRARRPWLGAQERMTTERRPAHDPACYLCPRNTRVNGSVNPDYQGVYVFDNDFMAVLPASGDAEQALRERDHALDAASALLQAQAETGICRVICFSPRHDVTLPDMPVEGIRAVVDVWIAQCNELGARDDIAYVQLFENKGEVMGCSNPHPHGQLWATSHVPTEIEKETLGQHAWLEAVQSGLTRAPLLLDYLETEQQRAERMLYENAHFAVMVPFWAVWPFETMIVAKRHHPRITTLDAGERTGLADAVKVITTAYDRLFDVSFPYSMGVHQAPFDGQLHMEWQLHLHFYPPLLRSASVKKFMVGYEMLAQPQRDLTPEQAAQRLRALI